MGSGRKLDAAFLVFRHGNGEAQRAPSKFMFVHHQAEGGWRDHPESDLAVARQTEVRDKADMEIVGAGRIRNPKRFMRHTQCRGIGWLRRPASLRSGHAEGFDLHVGGGKRGEVLVVF